MGFEVVRLEFGTGGGALPSIGIPVTRVHGRDFDSGIGSRFAASREVVFVVLDKLPRRQRGTFRNFSNGFGARG